MKIAGERDQRLDLAILDAQLFGHWNAKTRHRGGSSKGGNSVQVVTRVVTGNLNLQSDGSEIPGSRLPHGLFDRKDPSNF